jgi:hypothetical protein
LYNPTTLTTYHATKAIHKGSSNLNIPPLDIVMECTKENVVAPHHELEVI